MAETHSSSPEPSLPGIKDGTIRIGSNSTNVVAGSMLAAAGIFIFGVALFQLVAGDGFSAAISLFIVSTFGVLGGIAMMLYVNRLQLFSQSKTFRRTTGWRVSPRIEEGPFDEISTLTLRKEERSRGKHTVTMFPVYILWKSDPKRKDQIAITELSDGYEASFVLMQRFSEELGVSFQDETGRHRIELSTPSSLPDDVLAAEMSRIEIKKLPGSFGATYPAINAKQARTGIGVLRIVILILVVASLALPLVIGVASSQTNNLGVLIFGFLGMLCLLVCIPLAFPTWKRIQAAGGSEHLHLTADGLTIQVTNQGKIVSTQKLKFSDLTELRVEPRLDPSSALFLARIVIGKSQNRKVFGEGLTDSERDWLAELLGDSIRSFKE